MFRSSFFLALAVFVTVSGSAFAASHRVVVLSDLNGPYGSTKYDPSVTAAVQSAIRLRPDVILATGDLVAGMKTSLSNEQINAMWASFHKTVTNPIKAAGIPFAPAPGNHDASAYGAFKRERAIYKTQWDARKPAVEFVGDTSRYPYYYAFKVGKTLFLSLDATTVEPLDRTQKAWVIKTIDDHPELTTRVLFGHVPLVPFAQDGRQNDYLKDPKFEYELKKRNATMWISGHHHAYFPGERTTKVESDQKRMVFVGMACQGDGPRRLIGGTKRSPKSILMFEVDEAGIAKLQAFGGPKFDQEIPLESLPAYIGSGNLRIDRYRGR